MAGTLTVTGLSAGLSVGEKVIGPLTMTGSATVGTIVDVALQAGDNPVPVPAGATAVLIVIPTSNTGQLKLRTNLNAGDAGTPFGPVGWAALPLFPGTTSLIVNAAGTATVEISFL